MNESVRRQVSDTLIARSVKDKEYQCGQNKCFQVFLDHVFQQQHKNANKFKNIQN